MITLYDGRRQSVWFDRLIIWGICRELGIPLMVDPTVKLPCFPRARLTVISSYLQAADRAWTIVDASYWARDSSSWHDPRLEWKTEIARIPRDEGKDDEDDEDATYYERENARYEAHHPE